MNRLLRKLQVGLLYEMPLKLVSIGVLRIKMLASNSNDFIQLLMYKNQLNRPLGYVKKRGEERLTLLSGANVQLAERYRSLGANAMAKPTLVQEMTRVCKRSQKVLKVTGL
ncbi:MAG TPA: hypothetical protein VLA72_10995 [Anaerolineales bacterium]|nr:hypothetical protein [Anaerolineales bacterium]